MAAQIVTGHGLLNEGAPHDENGNRIWSHGFIGGTSGQGRAKCSCGEMSDVLPSGQKRKAWHREHKASIIGQDGES